MSLTKFLLSVPVLLLPTGLWAATSSWIVATGGSHNFTNTTKWEGGVVPGASDTALFTNTSTGGSTIILWTSPVINESVSFDYQSSSTIRAFNLSNANWLVTSRFAVEPSIGRTNFVRLQNGGTLSVTNSSGTALMEIGSGFGPATFDLNGSTLNVDTLIATNNAKFTFTGGTLNTFHGSSIFVPSAADNLRLENGVEWNMLGGTNNISLVAVSRTIQFHNATMRVSGVGTLLNAPIAQVGAFTTSTNNTLWIQDGAKAVISILQVGSNATASGAAQTLSGSGSVVVTNGGVLEANRITIGSDGKGTIAVTGATLQFTTNTPVIDLKMPGTFMLSSGTLAFSGVDAAAINGAITNISYSGANTLRLAQATNAMVSSYTFQAGGGQPFTILNLQDGRFQSTNLLIGSGGKLTGSGIVNSFSVTNNGTIAPGESPGVLSFTSNLVLGTSSLLDMEIGGTNSSDYDQIIVAGDLSITGALKLTLLNSFSPTVGDIFTLIDNQGTGPVSGQFNGLTNNQFLDASQNGLDAYFRIRYDGADGFGNDVVLLATIPEPSSLFMCGLALILGVWTRRR